MRHSTRSWTLVIAILTGIFGQAQVYIPSEDLRLALNAQVPGLVDASGMMDEEDPDIAQVDSLVILIWQATSTVELFGIEYLAALRSLSIEMVEVPPFFADSMIIPVFPASLETLTITGEVEFIMLGELPESIEAVFIQLNTGSSQGHVEFGGFPSFVPVLTLENIPHFSWPDPALIGSLKIRELAYPPTVSIPPVVTEQLELDDIVSAHLDLSNITARHILVYDLLIAGDLIWPLGVERVTYENSMEESLTGWPAQMDTLIVFYTSESCIPTLPNTLTYMFLPQVINCIPNWPDALIGYEHGTVEVDSTTATYCTILNSDCPDTYPALAGVVRMDLNNNGTVDAGEPIVPSSSVTIAPGGQSTGCAPDGSWQIGVPPGDYTITAASGYQYAVSVSPASHAGSVPTMGDVDLNNDFAVAVLPDIQDLRVHMYAVPARPGFDNQVHLRCENYGTMPVDAELTLAFEADQTWLGSSLAPASTTTNTATWNFQAMPIGAVQHIVVDLTTATTVALGTDITHTLTADPVSSDETPLNNVYTFNDSVVGSYDPNDKLLSPAVLTPAEVAMGETPIEYTIRFQNTGTYLAERVVILDTLSQDLQWESMRFIASSHENTWYIVDGVLHVIHNDIMLPDSNANEPESHGFFKFSMLPKTDLGNGSTIENIAHIVFDFNTPIITPPAVFTVDVAAGLEAGSTVSELRLLPNPAHDRIQLFGAEDTMLPYRIVDLLGQEVQRGTAPPNAWIEVQGLANGSYVLEATKAGVPTSLRFMKQ